MNLELPHDFTARPPTVDDAQAITDLICLCDTADYGEPDYSIEDVRADWRRSGFEAQRDAWLVHAPDGTLVGYGFAWDDGEHVRLEPTTCVHPAYRTLGLEDYHVARVHDRTRRFTTHHHVQWIVLDTHHSWIDRFNALGYHPTRHDYVMEIALAQSPPAPIIPDGFTLRPFERGHDERAVWATVQESFRDHRGHADIPYDEWAPTYLDHADWSPELSAVVMRGDELVAAAMTFNYFNGGWIRILGVRAPWRKHGLGLAILHHIFGEFFKRGIPRVGLGVDAENLSGATRLYERAGMQIKHHYVRYELEIKK